MNKILSIVILFSLLLGFIPIRAEEPTLKIYVEYHSWTDELVINHLDANTTRAFVNYTLIVINPTSEEQVVTHPNTCRFNMQFDFTLNESIDHEYYMEKEPYGCGEAITYDVFKPGITLVTSSFWIYLYENQEYSEDRTTFLDGIYEFSIPIMDYDNTGVVSNGISFVVFNGEVTSVEWPSPDEQNLHEYPTHDYADNGDFEPPTITDQSPLDNLDGDSFWEDLSFPFYSIVFCLLMTIYLKKSKLR